MTLAAIVWIQIRIHTIQRVKTGVRENHLIPYV